MSLFFFFFHVVLETEISSFLAQIWRFFDIQEVPYFAFLKVLNAFILDFF
ncbi:hypothetical protein P689_109 (plasmid) [Candidatus Riesia pediculischaeffi PTSU]|uniref:Uncharacterized protein n=1 Tax=Candidatus Riesia pediculischaeffi PTSU TaxID=1401651 RepID=A0A0C1S8X3_9ENTR|nr:hypothetical protein P689_109 [Candidatus Riesia pediculischaeffi PTSU]